MRAALYARVSTDKQAEKYGIPSQIEALRKRCLERSWTPILDGDKDAFIDDGYSGAELDQTGLESFAPSSQGRQEWMWFCPMTQTGFPESSTTR